MDFAHFSLTTICEICLKKFITIKFLNFFRFRRYNTKIDLALNTRLTSYRRSLACTSKIFIASYELFNIAFAYLNNTSHRAVLIYFRSCATQGVSAKYKIIDFTVI